MSTKKVQFTHERVEYVFLFDEALEGSKSLKISKISLMFSVHTGENSQILTVWNKKTYFSNLLMVDKIRKIGILVVYKSRTNLNFVL
jgi:hypothetical protein